MEHKETNFKQLDESSQSIITDDSDPRFSVNQKSPIPFILAAIAILALAAAGFLYYQNQQLLSQANIPSPSPSPNTNFTGTATPEQTTKLPFELTQLPGWNNLESACQKIDVKVSDAIQRELNIKEYTKQAFGFTNADIANIESTLPIKYQFKLANIPQQDYLVLGPLGEAEVNNLVVKGPDGVGYLEIKVFSNSAATGTESPARCLEEAVEIEYQQILSTLRFTDESHTSNESSKSHNQSASELGENTKIADKIGNTVIVYSALSAEEKSLLLEQVAKPLVHYSSDANGSDYVVSIHFEKSGQNLQDISYPYSMTIIYRDGSHAQEALSSTDDGIWWIPTCMGPCPLTQSFIDTYPLIAEKVR